MDSAAIKLELIQQLMSIVDDKTLRKVANFFKKEVVADEDNDITDVEFAQFRVEPARRDRGEIKFHTQEESMAEIRRLIAGKGR
ncbi:MAG: hypothetical protein IT230_06630 [Flavobacteriales bacterium]|nr:hypothetical protein [Flavobacteriales bacterium]